MPRKKSRPGSSHPRVLRITVDERLDESLFRVCVATLAEGVVDISEDHLDDWLDEDEKLIDPSNFLTQLGLADSAALRRRAARALIPHLPEDESVAPHQAPEQIWQALAEGQVFLTGEFTFESKPQACVDGELHDVEDGGTCRISIAPGALSFLRIDDIEYVKRGHKKLYSSALHSEES